MDSIYIVAMLAIIVFFTIAIVLRERINRIKASASAKYGNTELKGEAEIDATPSPSIQKDQEQEQNNQSSWDSVDISGNTNIFGSSILEIFRSGVRVAKNINFGGKTQINISEKSSKSNNINKQKIYEENNEIIKMQGILEPSGQEEFPTTISHKEQSSELEVEN